MPVALAHAASAAVSPGPCHRPGAAAQRGHASPLATGVVARDEPGVERTCQAVWQWSGALGGEPVVEGEGRLRLTGVYGLLSLSPVGTGQDPIGCHSTR